MQFKCFLALALIAAASTSAFANPAPMSAPDRTGSAAARTAPVAVKLNGLAGRGPFTLTKPTKVIYGDAVGPYNEKDLAPGSYICGDALFGDPKPRVDKGCLLLEAGNSTKLADEAGSFTLTEATAVAFGAKGVYSKVSLQPGTHACTTAIFGKPVSVDAPRTCHALANPAPRKLNPNGPRDDAILTDGAVDRAKYVAVANTMGTDAGIDYRYGPTSAHYGTTSNARLPDYAQRPDKGSLAVLKGTDGAAGKPQRPPNCLGHGYCPIYQFGKASYEPGDYSSSGLQIGYVTDATPDPLFFSKPYYGIASIQQFAANHGTVQTLPQLSWTRYQGFANNGADNDVNMEAYVGLNGKRPSWVPAVTPDFKPVAVGKCYGRGGWCTTSLAVWANGQVTAHGSNTNHNYLVGGLNDTAKVPTAITITNSGEFALVTVWDKVAIKGQVAVFALADGCQGCDPTNESRWYRNWGNAPKVYAGLPGLGNFVAIKLLGYVDLPADMKAPTEIWATTGKSEYDYYQSKFWEEPFEVERNRRGYEERGNPRSASIARTGMATVISKSEKTVAFVDLRPLFRYYRNQYFTSTQEAFDAMIANRGPAADQWPYTFANTPAQMPAVVKTVKLASAPTAVLMPNKDYHRSVVATQDGKLHVFGLGDGYLDQKAAATGKPADIVKLFSVDVGRNVTDITLPKDHGWETGYDTSTYSVDGRSKPFVFRYLIVNSRGDRKQQWIKFNADWTAGAVSKTLQDAKIMDPIAIEDSDNHGTESYVLSIADYAGRKVHNMLYGRIVLHTYGRETACSEANGGCDLLGNRPFEYGGYKDVPGQPFDVKGQNIN